MTGIHFEKTATELGQDMLDDVAGTIGGARAQTHGDMAITFEAIGLIKTALLALRPDGADAPITADQAARLEVVGKLVRAFAGAYNPDDDKDGAGYFACAHGIATASRRVSPVPTSPPGSYRDIMAKSPLGDPLHTPFHKVMEHVASQIKEHMAGHNG